VPNVIFGANLFHLLAITSVFVLRIKQPDLPRPYRTWGYPDTPLLYVAAATGPSSREHLQSRLDRGPVKVGKERVEK
jgi:hypothetical protein